MSASDHIRSIPGILIIVNMLVLLASYITTCLIWNSWSISFLLITFKTWYETIAYLIVLFLFLVNLLIFVGACRDTPIVGQSERKKGIILHGILLVLILIAAIVSSIAASASHDDGVINSARYIVSTIFDWVAFIVQALTLAYVIFAR